MNKKAREIFADFKDSNTIESLDGNEETILHRIAPVEKGSKGDLVFIDNKKFVEFILKNKPSGIVTSATLKPQFENQGIEVIFTAKNVNVAQALLKQKYSDRDVKKSEWGRVHKSALIHESVTIPESCVIGPNVVIGENVKIGERTVIMANTVIEYDAVIGEDCVIHPQCVIGYACIIGNRVIIKSCSVIGGEGYGYAQDEKRKSYRIPQTGTVIVEDDVSVGANNCFDRGAYEETRIGRGTKFDNLCHVAHNAKIGEDCLLTAGFIVAGSTKVGDRVIASGQTGILDHLTIANDVILVHRAGVSESILEPGVYAGIPPQPLSNYMKNVVISRKLVDLKSELKEVTKKIKELESKK